MKRGSEITSLFNTRCGRTLATRTVPTEYSTSQCGPGHGGGMEDLASSNEKWLHGASVWHIYTSSLCSADGHSIILQSIMITILM